MCNVTHLLLVIGTDVLRMLFTKCVMSLTSCGHMKRCDETAFHKMCNITHSLLVIGKDVMRLPFTKCAIPLTSYWSHDIFDEIDSQNVQCHSHAVGH